MCQWHTFCADRAASPMPRDLEPWVHGTLRRAIKKRTCVIYTCPFLSKVCGRRDLNPHGVATTRSLVVQTAYHYLSLKIISCNNKTFQSIDFSNFVRLQHNHFHPTPYITINTSLTFFLKKC